MTDDTVKKHSKLPWKVHKEGEVLCSEHYMVCIVSRSIDDCVESTIRNSNAKLIVDSVNQVQQYREALEFYANPSDYKSPLTGGMGKLYYDCGEIARNALKQKESE